MHLAVRNVEVLESCRPVRALLLKGAQYTIKDKEGKTAVDYIADVKNQKVKDELTSLLVNNGGGCNVLGGPTRF